MGTLDRTPRNYRSAARLLVMYACRSSMQPSWMQPEESQDLGQHFLVMSFRAALEANTSLRVRSQVAFFSSSSIHPSWERVVTSVCQLEPKMGILVLTRRGRESLRMAS